LSLVTCAISAIFRSKSGKLDSGKNVKKLKKNSTKVSKSSKKVQKKRKIEKKAAKRCAICGVFSKSDNISSRVAPIAYCVGEMMVEVE